MEFLVFISLEKRTDLSISAWENKVKFSNQIKRFWVKQLASSISTAGKKHSEIVGESDIEDFFSVYTFGLDNCFLVDVVLKKSTSVGTIINGLIKRTKLSRVNNMISWTLNFSEWFWTSIFLSPVENILDLINSNVTILCSVFIDNKNFFVAI